jgi:hypothetical protein
MGSVKVSNHFNPAESRHSPCSLKTFFIFFLTPVVFCYVQCCRSGMFISNLNFFIPNPGPKRHLSRMRIHKPKIVSLTQKMVTGAKLSERCSGMFVTEPDFSLPDPDPLGRCMDPDSDLDPDPPVFKQK